jgi:hypothetical protein
MNLAHAIFASTAIGCGVWLIILMLAQWVAS